MGIIVLFVAILPQFAVAGRQMFFAETPGPTEDKFTPRIRNTASALWIVYAGLTIACAGCLMIAGMHPFDSICNALSTLSAGGFSPNALSIFGYHSNLINWIVIFLCLLRVQVLYFNPALLQKENSLCFGRAKNLEFIHLQSLFCH